MKKYLLILLVSFSSFSQELNHCDDKKVLEISDIIIELTQSTKSKTTPEIKATLKIYQSVTSTLRGTCFSEEPLDSEFCEKARENMNQKFTEVNDANLSDNILKKYVKSVKDLVESSCSKLCE